MTVQILYKNKDNSEIIDKILYQWNSSIDWNLYGIDCYNILGGNLKFDCNLECGGSAIIDDCGSCVEGNTKKHCILNYLQDCNGECDGSFKTDDCGVCLDPDDSNWNESCKGCDGVVNSNLDFDDCGVCDGDDDCVINKTELVPKYGDELNNTTLHINYDNIDSMNKYFYNISESDTKSNIINGDYIPDEVFDNIDELINI